MGSMIFVRMDSEIEGQVLGKFSFDSSPEYSICKRFGLDPKKFRMEEVERTTNRAKYKVFGGQKMSEAVSFIGELEWKKPFYLQG